MKLPKSSVASRRVALLVLLLVSIFNYVDRTIISILQVPIKRDLALSLIEDARSHLRRYPASCSARKKREDAFSTLYDVNADHFWMTPEQTDAAYRQLEDYVFAPLIYNRSRTCCWNSSTTAIAMSA